MHKHIKAVPGRKTDVNDAEVNHNLCLVHSIFPSDISLFFHFYLNHPSLTNNLHQKKVAEATNISIELKLLLLE